MRTTSIASLTALAVVLPAAAFGAPAEGWYVGLGVAPAWLHADFHYADGSALGPHFDTGFMLDGAAGYKWDRNWRLEVEPYWAVADTSDADVRGPVAVVTPHSTATTPAKVPVTGDLRVGGMLANAAYDYPLDDRLSLTVGAGIGLASVSPRLSALPVSINPLIVGGAPQSTQVELARHIETSFAWQLLIGVMYSLRNDLDVQMDYRYHGNDDTTHTTSLARISPVKAQDDHVQALMFSVRYYP